MNKATLAVVRTELKRRKMYTSLWCLGVVVLSAFTVLAYGAIKGQADQLNKAFSGFSSSSGSFFGTSDMFSPTGYLNSQLLYIVLPIIFIILGITLSSALTNKEERHHTMELLLARPISRTGLLLAKIITATSIFLIITVATFLTILICSKIAGLDVGSVNLGLATLMMVLFAGGFGAVAFMLYVASQQTSRIAATIAILLSLGGYILTSIAGLVDSISWLAKLFPYYYYNPGQILEGHVSCGLIIYIVSMFAISLIVSLLGFRRRDIA